MTSLANFSPWPALLHLGAHLDAGWNHKDSTEAVMNCCELTRVDTLNQWFVWLMEMKHVFTWAGPAASRLLVDRGVILEAWTPQDKEAERHGFGLSKLMRGRTKDVSFTSSETRQMLLTARQRGTREITYFLLDHLCPVAAPGHIIVSDGWAATKAVPWATQGLRHEHCNNALKVKKGIAKPGGFASRSLKRASSMDSVVKPRLWVNRNWFDSNNMESLVNEVKKWCRKRNGTFTLQSHHVFFFFKKKVPMFEQKAKACEYVANCVAALKLTVLTQDDIES